MDFDIKSTFDFMAQSKLPTIIMSDCTDYTHIRIAYNAATGGFLSKSENADVIEDAIIAAANGEKYISKTNAQRIADVSALIERLLKKEQEVFALVQQGYSNADIATQLGISKHSVENYLSALYAKFSVASRETLQAL
jgi:DNA-binding NarL/FixJ family response regulator